MPSGTRAGTNSQEAELAPFDVVGVVADTADTAVGVVVDGDDGDGRWWEFALGWWTAFGTRRRISVGRKVEVRRTRSDSFSRLGFGLEVELLCIQCKVRLENGEERGDRPC
jgi:hypothetical protein